jgi:hypothetical protein
MMCYQAPLETVICNRYRYRHLEPEMGGVQGLWDYTVVFGVS